jgi:hypothetical protein
MNMWLFYNDVDKGPLYCLELGPQYVKAGPAFNFSSWEWGEGAHRSTPLAGPGFFLTTSYQSGRL